MEENVMKQMKLAKLTKGILDFMFYSGIVVCLTLPLSLKFVGNYYKLFQEYYYELLVLFFVSGAFAVLIILELRRMFSTVLKEDCFVEENVRSLRRMGNYSFCITFISLLRLFVAVTPAVLVVILVFVIAGLFSKVLANVFDQAITYKLENDLTI